MVDRGDPHGARGFVAQFAELAQPLLDLAQRRFDDRHQPFARLGGHDAAGVAGEQAHTQPRLQPADDVAQRRLRGAEFRGRTGEAALLRHRQERRQVAEMVTPHI
jgi:hypothetical protein